MKDLLGERPHARSVRLPVHLRAYLTRREAGGIHPPSVYPRVFALEGLLSHHEQNPGTTPLELFALLPLFGLPFELTL